MSENKPTKITEIPLATLKSDLAFCKHRIFLADTALRYGCEKRSDGENWATIRADAEVVVIKIEAELARRGEESGDD